MKKSITVKFVDFWPTFNVLDNKFIDALKVNYDVNVLSSEDTSTPDVLFYSCIGLKNEHLKYDCLKIYFTGENDFPNFNECDYTISFYDMDCCGRNLRYPLYMLYEVDQLLAPYCISDQQALSRNFCSVVMRNANNCNPMRLKIIDAVESYKPIAYGGPYRNNVGGPIENKIDFISGYKFNLALENSMVEGYVTEKILEPFAASTVPVYWGSDVAKKDFNPDAFINVSDYDSIDNFIEALKRIDSNPAEYLAMLRTPSCNRSSPEDFDSRLESYLNRIVDKMQKKRTSYGEMGNIQKRDKVVLPLWNMSYSRKIMKLMSIVSGKTR